MAIARRLRGASIAAASALAIACLNGCTTDKGTPSQLAGSSKGPHLADAVRQLLVAHQHRDWAASFSLLSPSSRAMYPTLSDWTASRQQLPAVTSFRLDSRSEGEGGDNRQKVEVEVGHVPGLDPFAGLTPARETQTFTGRRTSSGWAIDGDPTTDVLLPPDSEAVAVAAAWVADVQACDREGAKGLEAVSPLYGSAGAAAGLCGKQGRVHSADVRPLGQDDATASIVAQYSDAALQWGRTVRITSPAAFDVILAPVGTWKVIGISG